MGARIRGGRKRHRCAQRAIPQPVLIALRAGPRGCLLLAEEACDWRGGRDVSAYLSGRSRCRALGEGVCGREGVRGSVLGEARGGRRHERSGSEEYQHRGVA